MNIRQLKPVHAQQQNGATLFTALIFLIMLILLGTNAAQMSTQEEHMAGNIRNQDLAFQAAEAALKHAEQNLIAGEKIKDCFKTDGTLKTDAPTSCQNGLRPLDTCLPNTASYWNGSGDKDCHNSTPLPYYSWSNETSRKPASIRLDQDETINADLQPRYVVEKVPNVDSYRVTARGRGGDGVSVVILQTMLNIVP